MSIGEPFFAAAYVVGFVLVLAYVVIVALRLARLEAVAEELEDLVARPPADAGFSQLAPLERDSPPPVAAPPAA